MSSQWLDTESVSDFFYLFIFFPRQIFSFKSLTAFLPNTITPGYTCHMRKFIAFSPSIQQHSTSFRNVMGSVIMLLLNTLSWHTERCISFSQCLEQYITKTHGSLISFSKVFKRARHSNNDTTQPAALIFLEINDHLCGNGGKGLFISH